MYHKKTKKKKSTQRHRRRHRVGAATGIMKVVTESAAMIAGGLAGFFANQALKTAFTSLPLWAPGAVVAGGGIAVKKMAKSNDMLASVGDGLVVSGGLILLNETFLSVPGVSGANIGFVTNYDRSMKMKPSIQRQVGAPGFMDKSIGTVRDIAVISGPKVKRSIPSARVGGIYDN